MGNNDLFRDNIDKIKESNDITIDNNSGPISDLIRDNPIYDTINSIINKDEKQKGIITIKNIDATTQLPIINTVYTIIDLQSADIVEIVLTDERGRATSGRLDYGTSYKVRQTKIMQPYEVDKNEYNIEISNEKNELVTENHMFDFVTGIERKDDGLIDITELYIPVQTIMQKPELPNGCEITSLTSVLNYYDYEVSKTEMADVYLPKRPFQWINNKLYGANPYEAYAGNPRNDPGGFFSYAPPIVQAANQYIAEGEGMDKALDISGSTREEIIYQLGNGFPVVIWITIDLKKPWSEFSWHFYDSDEYFPAIDNSHTVVLNGYDETNVHVMDPLKGQVTYNANTFFDSYHVAGSHAMIIEKN
jgi:uncharacterized protein YvpB